VASDNTVMDSYRQQESDNIQIRNNRFTTIMNTAAEVKISRLKDEINTINTDLLILTYHMRDLNKRKSSVILTPYSYYKIQNTTKNIPEYCIDPNTASVNLPNSLIISGSDTYISPSECYTSLTNQSMMPGNYFGMNNNGNCMKIDEPLSSIVNANDNALTNTDSNEVSCTSGAISIYNSSNLVNASDTSLRGKIINDKIQIYDSSMYTESYATKNIMVSKNILNLFTRTVVTISRADGSNYTTRNARFELELTTSVGIYGVFAIYDPSSSDGENMNFHVYEMNGEYVLDEDNWAEIGEGSASSFISGWLTTVEYTLIEGNPCNDASITWHPVGKKKWNNMVAGGLGGEINNMSDCTTPPSNIDIFYSKAAIAYLEEGGDEGDTDYRNLVDASTYNPDTLRASIINKTKSLYAKIDLLNIEVANVAKYQREGENKHSNTVAVIKNGYNNVRQQMIPKHLIINDKIDKLNKLDMYHINSKYADTLIYSNSFRSFYIWWLFCLIVFILITRKLIK
jgi:hypothetical protein